MINPGDETLDRALVRISAQWEVAFSYGGRSSEGVLIDENWRVHATSLLDSELLAQVHDRMPVAAQLYEESLHETLGRLERVGQTASALTNAGRALWNMGDFNKAKEFFRRAIEADEHFSPGRLAFVEALIQGGQYEEAHRTVVELSDDNSFGPAASTLAADALFRLGRRQDSLKLLLDASERWKDNATIVFNAGIVLVSEGETNRAAHLFRKALRIDSSLAEAYHGLALCYVQQGMHRQAIKQFRIGLVAGGMSSAAIRNLSRIYQLTERHDDAIDVLSAHVDAHKLDAAARFMLAYSYAALGKYREARSHLFKILDQTSNADRPERPLPEGISYDGIFNNIGATYMGEHDLDEALKYYERALQMDGPAGLTVRENMVRRYQITSDLEEAERLVEEMSLLYGEVNQVKFLRAVNYYFRERFDAALELLDALRESGAKDPEVYMWLSYLKGEWELNYSEALKTAAQGFKGSSRSRVLLNNMAYYHILLNDFESAKKVMKRRAWPRGTPMATATEGLLSLASGDFHEGVTLYNNAKRGADPEFAKSIEQKKRFEMARFYLRASQPTRAVSELRRVVEIDSLEKLSKWQAGELLKDLEPSL